jgi:hypothetical protein
MAAGFQMLIDAAEDRGPMLFAKWGICDRAVIRSDAQIPVLAKAKADEVSVKGKAPALKAGASRDMPML